jgi:hypothetical protein
MTARKKEPSKVPTFGHVEDPFRCERCGATPKAGTNGFGRAILICSCGWADFIPRRVVRVSPR